MNILLGTAQARAMGAGRAGDEFSLGPTREGFTGQAAFELALKDKGGRCGRSLWKKGTVVAEVGR